VKRAIPVANEQALARGHSLESLIVRVFHLHPVITVDRLDDGRLFVQAHGVFPGFKPVPDVRPKPVGAQAGDRFREGHVVNPIGDLAGFGQLEDVRGRTPVRLLLDVRLAKFLQVRFQLVAAGDGGEPQANRDGRMRQPLHGCEPSIFRRRTDVVLARC
jgi:hypothetical protein